MSLLALLLLPIGTVSAQKMKAVDLGLSIKWAPCNVGASSPEQYGDYFAWGETAPWTTSFNWSRVINNAKL